MFECMAPIVLCDVVSVHWHYYCFYCAGHVRAASCHLPLVLHLYVEFLSFSQNTFADDFF